MQEIEVPVAPQGGPLGTNNLDSVCLWDYANLYALFLLGQAPLLDAGGLLVDTDLLATDCGERVLDYTMRCALPDSEKIETEKGHSFVGNFGLAHKWLEAPLQSDAKRWITACVVQHLNGLDVEVPIMLDGDHEALVPQPGSNFKDFTVEESTMFGDFFSDAPNPLWPPPVYACSEKHFDDACGTMTSQYLEQRICGSSSYCGLTYLGACNGIPNCSSTPEDFWVCDDGAGKVYSETIRSYLMPDGANAQYELCADF